MRFRLRCLLFAMIAASVLVQTMGCDEREVRGTALPVHASGRVAAPTGSTGLLTTLQAISADGMSAVKPVGDFTLPARTARPRPLAAYGRLPLAFERNEGQAASDKIRFLTRGKGYSLLLTSTGADLLLRTGGGGKHAEHRIGQKERARQKKEERGIAASLLRMTFIGAASHPVAEAREPLPGVVNYLIGNDPHRWHTGIPTYGKVHYKNVYPGIDLCYYGAQGQLEYDWLVAPGCDVSRIGMDIQGASSVRLTPEGDLRLAVGGGEMVERAPVVYQESRGLRLAVPAKWVVRADAGRGRSQVGFKVGKYDRSRPLIIDPILYYSTYLGGTGFDSASGVAVDSFGCAYITGQTSSTNFPTVNPFQSTNHANTSNGFTNAFVSKLNALGTALIYSTYLGGSDEDEAFGIAVDGQGSAYVTGLTQSSDFPTKNPLQGTIPSTTGAAFVTKLNATGNALVYSTYLGGSSGAEATGIAVDRQGAAYVTGGTGSVNFPTTVNVFQPVNNGHGVFGDGNAFITKINPAGSALVYSTFLGGSHGDSATGIALDSAGEAYVTGDTNSTDFPILNPNQSIPKGEGDAFVTKINTDATSILFSTYLGGSAIDHCHAIAVDDNGSVYVTGDTNSTDFPEINAFQMSNHNTGGVSTGFVTKFNSAGAILYSTYLGGRGDSVGNGESGDGIAVDSLGDAFVTGSSSSPDFPLVNPIQATNGGGNAFLAVLNPAGTGLVFSTYLGGTGGDVGLSIALDSLANPTVVGETRSHDFPITAGALQTTNHTTLAANAFVARMQLHAPVGDFNGDERPDLLFQNQASGHLALWDMNGATFLDGVSLPNSPDAGWKVVGVGDFNGDGKPDILYQNQTSNQLAIWFMNGTTLLGGVLVPQIPAAGYSVVGVGDFNGDGKPDILFQNQNTGQLAIWFFNGPAYSSGLAIPAVPASGYKVVGVGDFNGDGHEDIVFQNQASGQIAVWFFQGANFAGGVALPYAVAPNYQIVAVADYNGDTHPDLLFQNKITGQLAVWYMVGTTFAGGTSLSATSVPGWSVVGPH